ncbi:MAG: SDR family oxidoreductase [Chloroflexi bacterium]|nr:SDR family oxidoreductase [Chloroflexota bacterium]
MQHILITGASTGIGYDAARDLIEHGYHVFGSVRKQSDANRVKNELGERFTPLLFDVTDEAGVKTAVPQVEATVGKHGLFGLVNNAGVAVPGPFMHLPLNELRRQIEINVIGLLSVTQAFLPLLGAQKDASHPPGRIINISSTSGKTAYPFVGPYAVSKHALEALSTALRRELIIYGIDVIVINPGPIQTPIWDKAEEAEITPYVNTDYEAFLRQAQAFTIARGRAGMPVEAVSKVIRKALESKRPSTYYPVVRSRLLNWHIPQWLPARWIDKIAARKLGLR